MKRSPSAIRSHDIHSVVLDALKERGLMNANGEFRKEYFYRIFRAHYFPGQSLAKGLEDLCDRLMNAVLCKGRAPLWIERVILIDWLFSSLEACRHYSDWLGVLGQAPAPLIKPKNLPLEEMRGHHRRVCLDILASTPYPTRTQISRRAIRTYQWLLRNDSAWLDEVCPISHPPLQPDLFASS